MAATQKISLGIDFGTESVRALLVDLSGRERASAVVRYRHGQITDALPTAPKKKLPPHYALQHPTDWIDSSARAIKRAVKVGRIDARDVIGIGVDFTSCTMLPARADGTPLCLAPKLAKRPLAWPKLWKHHGAVAQTERINAVARDRNEPLLKRFG
jgi:L-ribulokinase